MAMPVRIEAKAWTDPRFVLLGHLAGIDKWSARDRTAFVWSHLTEEDLRILPAAMIDALAELQGFAGHLVAAGLGELVDGGVRLKGADDERVGWRAKRQEAGRLGGLAKAARASVDAPQLSKASKTGSNASPEPSKTVAKTYPLSLSLSLSPSLTQEDPEREDSPLSREAPAAPAAPVAEKPRRAAPEPPAEAMELAGYLLEAIRAHTPDYQVQGTLAGWGREIDLAMRIDGRTADQLRAVVDYAHRSPEPFWRSNLLSGTKLRAKFDAVEIQRRERGSRAGPAGAPRGVDRYAEIERIKADLKARGM